MTNAIEVRGLSRKLGTVQAVAGFDLAVAVGEIVGLLGPNGAGKTSAIEAIAGLAEPDEGEIAICGIDARARPREAKRRTGVVLQATGLQDALTPREAIALFSVLLGVPGEADALLARFGLVDKADARIATLSGGQQQRLALALAFIGKPGALLLDEPTTGLDPQMRRAIHDHVRDLREEGAAILLATHDMEEAAMLCDRVIVLDRGRIVAEGTPAALIAGDSDAVHAVVQTDRAPAEGWPDSIPHASDLRAETMCLRFVTDDLNAAMATLIAWLDAREIRIVSLQAGSATLEDVILRLAAAPGPD